MLADFFTKPLQGGLYKRFREIIMGWKHVDTIRDVKMSPHKEHVENSVRGDITDIARKPRISYLEAATDGRTMTTTETTSEDNHKVMSR
jgi:hypothetical protein